MRVRFWGTRGSIPTPGPRTVRYGGNTLCVEVRAADGTLIVLDGGSGLFPLGRRLLASEPRPIQAHIMLTHTHWDHIQGIPFFGPIYEEGNLVRVYAPRDPKTPLRQLLEGQMSFHNAPAPSPAVEYVELDEQEFTIGSVRVVTQYLNHTALCLGYRLEADGRVLTHCTDVEPHARSLLRSDSGDLGRVRKDRWGKVRAILHREDARLVSFAQGSDLHIQDSMYTPEEYPSKLGWGHSPCDFSTDVALAAEVRRFVLFHHDPEHDDEFVDAMVERCRQRVSRFDEPPEVFGAWEGLEIDL